LAILDFAPGDLRAGQRDALLWLEANWSKYDVFALQVPVAGGKSWIAVTLSRWLAAQEKFVALVTPSKQLQDQYTAEFPEYPDLKGKDNYKCGLGPKLSCEDGYDLQNKHCDNCPYVCAKEEVRDSPIAVYNFWTYLYHKVSAERDVLLVDEAHNLTPTLLGMSELNVWRSNYPWVDRDLRTHGDLAAWLERNVKKFEDELEELKGEPDSAKERRKLNKRIETWQRLLWDLRSAGDNFHYNVESVQTRGGKTTQRLRIAPLSTRQLAPRLWPKNRKVSKVVLLSATLDLKDVEDLRLPSPKLGVFRCVSPIPVAHRPFVAVPVADLSFKNRAKGLPKVAAWLRETAETHATEKGLVHCTYGLAQELKQLLGDHPRFVWHEKDDKLEQYQAFRDSPEPLILVASGMAEGIDLAYDVGRWQVVLGLPYPNWGDSWVQHKNRQDSTWYTRETVRTIQQQYGRICRTPTDYGVTYCVDSRFARFFFDAAPYWADWFREAVTDQLPHKLEEAG
jgi:Rad3-related DNA helicase